MGANIEVDRQLISRCLAGSTTAFHELVEQLKQPAYYHALSLTGDPDEALDVSQEAFARAWQNIGLFDPERPFYPWYYTMLKRLALNSIRARARRRECAAEEAIYAEATDDSTPETRHHADRTAAMVQATLKAMTLVDREILCLKDIHEHSYRDIAMILDIPTGTVMSRLYTARRRFKQLVEDSGYEYP